MDMDVCDMADVKETEAARRRILNNIYEELAARGLITPEEKRELKSEGDVGRRDDRM